MSDLNPRLETVWRKLAEKSKGKLVLRATAEWKFCRHVNILIYTSHEGPNGLTLGRLDCSFPSDISLLSVNVATSGGSLWDQWLEITEPDAFAWQTTPNWWTTRLGAASLAMSNNHRKQIRITEDSGLLMQAYVLMERDLSLKLNDKKYELPEHEKECEWLKTCIRRVRALITHYNYNLTLAGDLFKLKLR